MRKVAWTFFALGLLLILSTKYVIGHADSANPVINAASIGLGIVLQLLDRPSTAIEANTMLKQLVGVYVVVAGVLFGFGYNRYINDQIPFLEEFRRAPWHLRAISYVLLAAIPVMALGILWALSAA